MTTTLRLSNGAKNLAAIKSLRSDNPNPEVLKLFMGWGAASGALIPNTDLTDESEAAVISREVLEVLEPEEIDEAKASILNAYYTPHWFIPLVWEALAHIGFKGGAILEPSCGTLRFLEHQPQAMRKHSKWVAIEADPIPAEISRILYPEATIYSRRFEQCALPENSFDLVVGNVPFGDFSPADPIYNKDGYLIHSYFFYKSVRLVRPGGLVALITGQGTMDSGRDKKLREYMAQNGELILSIRLPAEAHEGAGASCDLLIYRKRVPGEYLNPKQDWVHQAPAFEEDANRLAMLPKADAEKLMGEERLLKINRYYALNPGRLLGKLAPMGKYDNKRTCVEDDGRDVPAAVREQIAELRTDWYESTGEAEITVLPEEYQSLPQGAFLEHNNTIMVRCREKLVSVPKKHHDCVRSALELLHLYMRLLNFERTNPDDDRAAILRKDLQDCYYDFVFTFGNLREEKNFELLSGDSRFINLMSMEVVMEDGIVQSPIFFRRTVRPMPEAGQCESPSDALAQSLNHFGYPKPRFIANLLDLPVEEAMASLSDAGLVYYDPAPGKWVTADDYLSGDVKTKLAEALEHQLNINASALRNVLPTPVLPPADPAIQQECAIALEIPINMMTDDARLALFSQTLAVQLGAVWVPPEVISEFVCHLMGSSDYPLHPQQVHIKYVVKPFSMWSVNTDMAVANSPSNTEKWGTADRSGLQLVELALNLQDPKIYRETKDGRVLDQTATEACRAKVEALRADFAAWAWRDRTRAVRLTLEYNEKVNRTRHRTYNGEHLTFPGSNPERTLRPHQKNAVWRALQQVKGMGTLIGHTVGAGKSWVMAALCMEARRLGIASKPVIGVLNDTLPGFVDDCRELYPEAIILCPEGKDMDGPNRQIFINRIATEDFDIAILPHSLIFDIPMSDDYARAHIGKELREVEEALGLRGDLSKSAQRRLQNRKKAIESKIAKLGDSKRKKASLTWEQLGIDMYCLDESQVAKKLGFVTTQDDVAGLDTGESQCGRDTKMKLEYILGRGGKGIFSTGTPVTNTLAELFNLMRFLAHDALERMGLASFDAWSSLFTETETASEVSPEGGFQVKTRFARFTNLFELMELYWSFADLISSSELGLTRPIPIFLEETVDSSEDLAQYMAYLQARATAIRQGDVEPEDDNLLVVVNDGRKSAAALRLVRSNALDDPNDKLNNAIWCIWQIWKDTTSVRGTQIVFCNIGTPRTDDQFDIYREMEQKLIALGIPSREVAFIHDAKNSQKKRIMTRKVNTGKIRVVIASTQKGGTGINMQRRLVALHHIEPDWMPAQIKQREGRIERQGNLFKRVLIFRHLTMGIRGMAGFDAFFWQKLFQKNRFIDQVDRRTLTSRHSEDIGEVTMNYASLMAIASGDPMLKDESDLKAEKKRLELRGAAQKSQQLSLAWELNNAITKVDCAAEIEAKIMADAQAAIEFDGVVKMGSHLHEDPSKIGAGVLSKVKDALKIMGSRPVRAGVVESCGLDIYLVRGFGTDIKGVVTSDVRDADCHYPFQLHRGSAAATGHALLDAIRFGISQTLENFREQTEVAKTRMKELSTIRSEPFPGADRLLEIDARLAEIKQKKKDMEKAATEAAANKPAATETRVQYGVARLVPPDPQVIDYLLNREYQPEWLKLLPGIVEEMRENEAEIEAAEAARVKAHSPTKAVVIKADSADNEAARARLLSQRPTFAAAGATQDSLF